MRFKHIRQQDITQCGAACLTMLCHYYGREISLSDVSRHCHATTEGVSLLSLAQSAEELGFTTSAYRLTLEALRTTPLPCILHWSQNHFVVLYHIKREKQFYIADPAKGKMVYSTDIFQQHWMGNTSFREKKGIALVLTPTERLKDISGNEKRGKNSSGFLLRYIRPYRKILFQILIGLVLSCMLQLVLPFLTQSIVDVGIRDKSIGFIWMILLGEWMIILGKTATDFLRRWLLLHISMRINIALVSDFFIKLLQLPMSFFDTRLLGDLLQRIGDHSRVQNFLTTQVLSIAFNSLSFLIFGWILFIYHPVIFAVFIAGSLLYGLWITTFLKRRKILDYELFEQQAISQSRTYQFLTSMQEIKLQDCEQRRRWEWEDIQADLFGIQMKTLKLQQTQEAGAICLNEVKNILITVLAATAVIHGQMTLGAMLAVQYIIGQLNSPVEQFVTFIYSLQDVKISLERIHDIHERREEDDNSHHNEGFPAGKTMQLNDVCFKYDPHSLKDTLSHVSFDIPEGKVTAIVGASGSGKTTLVKLLLGFYPVSQGNIALSGRDINSYHLKWWRRHCGVVMQDGVIFSETIERNIAVDDGDVDEERLIHAARIANIHDFIAGLPLRYHTRIGQDGVGLSQGQKQRILIARAVYKHPDFIFLDEATNALDAKNERMIVENLRTFYQGRTVVVVAHRLSTVKDADQIVVMEGGCVVERGTHSSLIEQRGSYYHLVKNQLELGN